MDVALIQVPYDCGHREERMGRGPGHLLSRGAAERVERAAGGTAIPARIDTDEAFPKEISTAFHLAGKLSGEVARARRQGAFPFVLAGNCTSSLGTVSGLLDVPRPGVVWLDAHGDLNTPETTLTGLLDGMPAAILTGRCWRAMADAIPGFQRLPDEALLHVGARSIDPGEEEILGASAIHYVPGTLFREGGAAAVEPALEAFARRVDAIYLHIDLDVHDSTLAPANVYVVPDGPTPEQVRDYVAAIAARLPVAAAALTAFDPACDVHGTTTEAALALMETIVSAVAER